MKNLTFSTELTDTMLDEKYASGSTVALLVQAGIANAAATYELKNQNSLQLMFRAPQLVVSSFVVLAKGEVAL